MRHAPSRPSALAVAGVLASALIAAPALAQTAPASGEATGLRYLSWPGKAVRSAPARVAASSAPAVAFVPPAPSPVADQPTRRAEASPRQGLTPASAFYTPGASINGRFAAEPSAPQPAPPPSPVLTPDPSPEPEGQPAQPRMRRVAESPRVVAAAAVVEPPAPSVPPPEPAPQPVEAAPAAADPMAPRRDAPIFRLQRQAAAPEPTPAGAVAHGTTPAPADPSSSGARYYSVHRQHGQRPDAIAAPEPAWLDTMPVQLATAPSASATDLAAPPAAPALRRDASGKLQPAAPLVSGDPS